MLLNLRLRFDLLLTGKSKNTSLAMLKFSHFHMIIYLTSYFPQTCAQVKKWDVCIRNIFICQIMSIDHFAIIRESFMKIISRKCLIHSSHFFPEHMQLILGGLYNYVMCKNTFVMRKFSYKQLLPYMYTLRTCYDRFLHCINNSR